MTKMNDEFMQATMKDHFEKKDSDDPFSQKNFDIWLENFKRTNHGDIKFIRYIVLLKLLKES